MTLANHKARRKSNEPIKTQSLLRLADVTIGFGFTSDWMKKWCEIFNQSCNVHVLMQNQLRFDTRVKTALM